MGNRAETLTGNVAEAAPEVGLVPARDGLGHQRVGRKRTEEIPVLGEGRGHFDAAGAEHREDVRGIHLTVAFSSAFRLAPLFRPRNYSPMLSTARPARAI